MQVVGLTNEGRHNLLLLHKQAHDKRCIVEFHTYIYKAKLSVCEVGLFSIEKYYNSPTYIYLPVLGPYFSSPLMGVNLGGYMFSKCDRSFHELLQWEI